MPPAPRGWPRPGVPRPRALDRPAHGAERLPAALLGDGGEPELGRHHRRDFLEVQTPPSSGEVFSRSRKHIEDRWGQESSAGAPLPRRRSPRA